MISVAPWVARAAAALAFCSTAVAFTANAPSAHAQGAATSDPRVTAALQWRNLGPFRAGRVGGVSGAIGQPGVYYAGFPGGGLWKTTNAGVSWVPIFDSVKEVSSVGAVEVAPSNANVVYVGTGDMITGGTLDQGNGVYKSIDAGKTWRNVGLQGTKHIQAISVDPRSPDVVLVGGLGDHVNLSDWRGVFRTTDGGKTWTKTLFVDNQIGAYKLGRAYDVPDVVFATVGRHYAPPSQAPRGYRSFNLPNATPGDTGKSATALYKSLDGGVTWKEVTSFPRSDGRMAVAVATGTNAQRVYVISNRALYRSDDGGTTWKQMAADDERIRNGQGGYSAGVFVNPKNPDVVYTINTAAYKSMDGGVTFTGMKGAPGGDDPQVMWLDPTNENRLFLGLDQGATISLDGGATWSSWYNQSTEQLYHLSADQSYPSWIYATQQDAGAIRTRLRGNYGAITMFDWNSVNGWEWGTIIPDPRDANTVYASGNGIVKISYPSEQWINVSPTIDPALRGTATSSLPIKFAAWNTRQLLAGFNFVTSTLDGGATWKTLSPELGVPKGMDSATATNTLGGRGAIESMSTAAPGTIWAGTNNGLIHVSRDAGATWSDVSIKDLPNPRRANVSSIDASPHVAGTAYAAIEYLRSGDHTPYLYRTRDFGKTWTKIVNGLPTDEPSGSLTRVVRTDPKKAGLLYAGTESGLYVSFDDGDHWQSLQNNLPNTPVRDLVIKGNDLVIATHGRGLWALDDISMLRQMTAKVASAPVHLFTPGAAVRVRRNVNADTPLPPEIPHALNPLDGAMIDYWLGSATSKVSIDIVDASGAVVRHYANDPISPVEEAAKPPHPNFWVASPQPLSTTAGAHRVNWDLRRDPPSVFSHGFEISANPGLTPASPEGALVPLGTYTVKITTPNGTASAPVQVTPDPRSRSSAAAIAAQYAHARSISTAATLAFNDDAAVTALRAAFGKIGANASSDVTTALTAARASLDSVAGAPGGGGRRGGGAPATSNSKPSFRALNGTLAGLLTAQDNGDMAPTPAMRAAYTKACGDLSAQHAALQKVMTVRVGALNAALKKAQQAGIDVAPLGTLPACR